VDKSIESNEEKAVKIERNEMRRFRSLGGMAAIVIGAVLLAFPMMVAAEAPDYSDYDGSPSCLGCHGENFNQWTVSGHPYKLMKSEEARNRPIPLPEGMDWDDVTYVIGGYKWKSRYLDDEGYIYTPSDGNNQYNNLTGEWSDYHPGETRPYNCGRCHTTAWIEDETPTDDDLTNNQDELEGIYGTFFAGGIHCEECHGPGGDMTVDMSAPDGSSFCGRCHNRFDAGTFPPPEENFIPASGGFIRHHEQYNEFLASPHAASNCTDGVDKCPTECTDCHNPHEKGEFSIWEDGERKWEGSDRVGEGAQCGVDCHADIGLAFAETTMADYNVECKDCHMPFATKSAQALGPHQGDLQTHIFYINTDPAADMFNAAGDRVVLDPNGKAMVTMDFACQRCHETASLEELAKFAKDFHNPVKDLSDIGLDPGLTGAWYDETRSGEGWVLEVGYNASGAMFMFASFYTYDGLGGQVYLLAEAGAAAISGTTATAAVYYTDGAMWGADFNPADVIRTPWGTGTLTFPTCGEGNVVLTPDADAIALGYTELTTTITRALDPGIACPTFVNNAD